VIVRGRASIECRPPSFVLVDEGDTVSYFRGSTAPPASWNTRGFNDAGWSRGDLGIGYGDGDDATILTDMEDNYVSVYCRMVFDLADHGITESGVTSLDLAVRFDDGVVIYLNGDEVARANLPSGGISNTTVAASTVGNAPTFCDVFESTDDASGGCMIVRLPVESLVDGVNVLAASVHNRNLGSSDLTFVPTLVAQGLVVPPGPVFRRGDADDNGRLEVTDAVRILLWLFAGASAPTCVDTADVDNNGSGEVSDVIGLLGYLFRAGPPPAEPGPARCGLDDDIESGCDEYTSCGI
jgi:hypothetical protein